MFDFELRPEGDFADTKGFVLHMEVGTRAIYLCAALFLNVVIALISSGPVILGWIR